MSLRGTDTASYLAAERCHVVASPDGAWAAIVEAQRVVVVELQHAANVAEIGVATAVEQTDVAWVGAPPRLLILSRYASHSTVYLIELEGPRVRAEIQIESAMRIGATIGAYALLVGTRNAGSSAVLTAGDAQLTAYLFPSRALPSAVGAAGSQFVVAIPGAIEEWDPQRRAPRNRLRLPRAAQIAQLGGNERVVWITTHQDPTRVEVIPRIQPAPSRSYELPEPIAHVSAHPGRDLLACVGRETGRVHVVDLDGRAGIRTLSFAGLDRVDTAALFAGATVGVVAAQAGRPLGLYVLEGLATIAPPRPAPPVAPAAQRSARPEPPAAVIAPAEPPARVVARRPSLRAASAAPPEVVASAAAAPSAASAVGEAAPSVETAVGEAATSVETAVGEAAPPPAEATVCEPARSSPGAGLRSALRAPAEPQVVRAPAAPGDRARLRQPARWASELGGGANDPPRPSPIPVDTTLRQRRVARPPAPPELTTVVEPTARDSQDAVARSRRASVRSRSRARAPETTMAAARRASTAALDVGRSIALRPAQATSPARRVLRPHASATPATASEISLGDTSGASEISLGGTSAASEISLGAGASTLVLPGQVASSHRASARAPKRLRLRRLGSEATSDRSRAAGDPAPDDPSAAAADAPTDRPIVRPPIDRAMAALAPLTPPTRCSPDEYEAMLEHYRQYVVSTALLAIAQDWDRGRLAFASADRPIFEAEVFGILGRGSGLAPERMREAVEAREAAAAALQRAWSALAGRQSPVDVICAEYGLGTLAELVLLFVAAPALWGELARLYRILSHDAGRAPCDEHLLWQLLGHTAHRAEIARELDPDGPLRYHGLIRGNDRGRPFQQLAAHPTVVKLLAGATVDVDLARGVARVPDRIPLDQLMIPTVVIDRALADLVAAPAGRGRVVVAGRSGTGRRTLLASLAELAGRTLATIDGAMLLREKRIDALAGLLQQAHLSGWLPCVDGLETIASDDDAARGAVRELLRDHPGPLAVRLPRHVVPPLVPGYVLIELPASSIAERAAQWSEILAASDLAVRDLDELAARFTVGPGTIHRVVTRVARAAPASADRVADRAADREIDSALRQYLESKLGSVATRVTRLARWSQIVLPADIQDSIVELVARIRHRRTVYDTWGFDRVMSTSRGLTALFEGGPGTGKTLVAGAIANELGLDLYRIDLSRVMSKWIGETEQNLAKVFEAAEEGQALLLFDEADSLFGKRSEVRNASDRHANLETNYLLQRLDSFEGVAVLTTNFGTAIDPAFKRRLSSRLTFPFPDDEARQRLWRIHLPPQLPLAGALDLAGLARRYKMSGGYIRNAALRAAFLAAEEEAALSQDHLERAVRAEFREGGKLAESGILE